MSKYKLSNYERETNINFNEDEKVATVYTCKPSLIKKMDNFCEKYPADYELIFEDEQSKTYQINKKFVSIRGPQKKRKLTEDEKEVLRNRMINMQLKRKIQNQK